MTGRARGERLKKADRRSSGLQGRKTLTGRTLTTPYRAGVLGCCFTLVLGAFHPLSTAALAGEVSLRAG